MFSTAHLASGVALALALGLEGAPFAAVVLASVLTDWDYVFQLLTGRNHRTLLSHSPLVHIAILGPIGAFEPIAWWILLGSLLHLSLDIWEYGIRLNPFSRRIYGFRLLKGVEKLDFRSYMKMYFSDKRFLAAEAVLATLAVGLGLLRAAGIV